VPRNVVTVSPLWVLPLPARRCERRRILQGVAERHRPTPHKRGDSLHLHFSKSIDPLAARAQVIGWLDEINPEWRKYVKVYPRE